MLVLLSSSPCLLLRLRPQPLPDNGALHRLRIQITEPTCGILWITGLRDCGFSAKKCGSWRGSLAFVSLVCGLLAINGGRTPSTCTSEQRCNLLQHARCRLSCPIFQKLRNLFLHYGDLFSLSTSQVSTTNCRACCPLSHFTMPASSRHNPAAGRRGTASAGPSLHQLVRI
jgi:hypothetical protein